MTTLYLNPAAGYPLDAAEGSLGEFNPLLKPIITNPAEVERVESLRLSNGEHLYVEVANKFARWLSKKPMYMLYPEIGGFANLGSYLPNTLATPSSVTPTRSGNQYVLDASTKLLDTHITTQANRILDPIFGNATITTNWAAQGAALSRVEEKEQTGVVGPVAKIVVAKEVASAGLRTNANISANVLRTDTGAWVKAPLGANMKLEVIGFKTGGVQTDTMTVGFTATGNWQFVKGTKASWAAETIEARLFIGTTGTANPEITFTVGAVLHSGGRATEITAEEMFPTLPQLAGGIAGFEGTLNSSASRVGPFASGTARTFVIGFNSLNAAATIGLIGEQTANGVYQNNTGKLVIRNNGTDISFLPENLVVAGTSAQFAVVFSDLLNTVASYKNGALQESKADANQFLPSASTMRLGSALGTSVAAGSFGPVGVFPYALTEAELAELILP